MRRFRKVKKKKMFREKNLTKCRLCSKESMNLTLKGFCLCIARDEDFIVNEQLGTRMINPLKVMSLVSEYNDKINSLPEEYLEKEAVRAVRSTPTNAEKKHFYQSWEWKKLRLKILDSQGRECLSCGTDKHLCVDHIRPIHRFWEQRLDPDNLQVLCNDCNMGKGVMTRDFRKK